MLWKNCMLLICSVFLSFVIYDSIRLHLDVQIILFWRHFKIKRPLMVIIFSENSSCSFVVSLRHFAYLETWPSIILLSPWCFSSSVTNCPLICENFRVTWAYNAFFKNPILASVLFKFIVNQYNLLQYSATRFGRLI